MATLIKADGSEADVIFQKNPHKLAQWQLLVGGYVQAVKLPDGRYLLCDEDGRTSSKSFNVKASALWGATVVGDVVLCSGKEFRSA